MINLSTVWNSTNIYERQRHRDGIILKVENKLISGNVGFSWIKNTSSFFPLSLRLVTEINKYINIIVILDFIYVSESYLKDLRGENLDLSVNNM